MDSTVCLPLAAVRFWLKGIFPHGNAVLIGSNGLLSMIGLPCYCPSGHSVTATAMA